MALPIFIVTIFVSAFLLFLVQPIVGKLILPRLGGTPQVWNTCMVFFQSALLLGYAYTHTVTTRLKLRQQLMVHGGLLIVPIIMMLTFQMYDMSQAWEFPAGSNPIVSALTLLGIIVGVPFFVVSTSAPLLQRWFAYSGHTTAKDPYFLYAASNLGSLLSLYFYPIVIEPNTFLRTQSLIWFGGYLFLGACVVYCVYTIFKLAPPDAVLAAEAAAEASKLAEAPPPVGDDPVPAPAPAAETSTAVKAGNAPGSPGARAIQRKKGMKLGGAPADDKPGIARQKEVPDISYGAAAAMTTWRRIRWVLLAAVPSSLMLGTTSYISTDLSPFPLVWIIPLSLYLLSFILVYLHFWTGKRVFTFGPGYTMHDAVLYVLQPLGTLALAFVILTKGFSPVGTTMWLMAGFFANALGCHGELAKDRPTTRHLTEYFLLMSVGGMIGGLFNGIIAPIIFQTGVLEFNIAICVACFVRPLYIASGWFEELIYSLFPGFQGWVRSQGDEMAKSMGRPAPNSTYLFSYFLDVVFAVLLCAYVWGMTGHLNQEGNLRAWAKFMPFLSLERGGAMVAFNILVFFLPMVFCFFFAGRPARMGLGVTALLLGYLYFATGDDRQFLEGGVRRTYFGVLRVQAVTEPTRETIVRDEEERALFRTEAAVSPNGEKFTPHYPFTFLMHGTTYHGRNYYTDYKDKYEKARVDLSRLATTYYHRYGPVGVVMEQYNWFPGAQNTFRADARMPATIVGQVAAALGVGNLPLAALVETQSEPPYATIGLGTGTMVSYARPYQHMTYYEIDDVIRSFSLPTDDDDGRPASRDGFFTYLQHAVKRGVNQEVIMGDARQSLSDKREASNRENSFVFSYDFDKKKYDVPLHSPSPLFPNRERYYKAINVDAFSSDAIPIHLVTEQAIALYLSKMTPDGVLCVHTSNRHMDLVVPVSRIALALSKRYQDQAGVDLDKGTVNAKDLERLFPPKEGEPFDLNKAKDAYVKSKEVNVRVGKDRADRERYMGHFSSEYVMIYRGDGFAKYLESLEKKKQELIAEKRMRPLPQADERERTVYGWAPDGLQILNADVEWYDPFVNHDRTRGPNRRIMRAVTEKDALWTDDYSHILSVIRWPEWWPF